MHASDGKQGSASTATERGDLQGDELPDDRSQLPRWGYVTEGKVAFRFADREETYEAGDAYYVPPGHTPIHFAGSEIVEFSPTDGLGETIGVVLENLRAAGVEA